MVKVICIVGLPGSGKTYLAQQLLQDNPGFVLFDDMRSKEDLQSALHTLDSGANCILIDVNFCRESTRKVAEHLLKEHHKAEVEWIFFENNPEKCKKNVLHRHCIGDTRKVEGTIKMFQKIYSVPPDIVARDIWEEKNV